MKTISFNEQMRKIGERSVQEGYEKFKRESIARYQKEREEKEQKETVAPPVQQSPNIVVHDSPRR